MKFVKNPVFSNVGGRGYYTIECSHENGHPNTLLKVSESTFNNQTKYNASLAEHASRIASIQDVVGTVIQDSSMSSIGPKSFILQAIETEYFVLLAAVLTYVLAIESPTISGAVSAIQTARTAESATVFLATDEDALTGYFTLLVSKGYMPTADITTFKTWVELNDVEAIKESRFEEFVSI
jgi:hypothetical protein